MLQTRIDGGNLPDVVVTPGLVRIAELAERGDVIDLRDVIGEDALRQNGGLTVAKRVCEIADDDGLRVIPRLWTTGISIAAAAHLAAVTPRCDYIEYLPPELCEAGLCEGLRLDELQMVDGTIPLPTQPGLGVELDRDALDAYATGAQRVG